MSDRLEGKRVAFLVANEGVEEVELTEPLKAVREAGAETELLAPEAGDVQAFNHLDKGGTFTAKRAVGDADPGEFDALVLPGGVANPDQLRTRAGAPVDSYGVGSALLRGSFDFTADVGEVDGRPGGKVGRELRPNPRLRAVE